MTSLGSIRPVEASRVAAVQGPVPVCPAGRVVAAGRLVEPGMLKTAIGALPRRRGETLMDFSSRIIR